MSECVVRMEMPKSCRECSFMTGCSFCEGYSDSCVLAPDGVECGWDFYHGEGPTKRPDWCPIICSLPEGHGDLVDWNDVEKELEATFADYVDDAPYLDNGQPGFLRRKVYPDALMIRPIKAKIIIPEEGGKENR